MPGTDLERADSVSRSPVMSETTVPSGTVTPAGFMGAVASIALKATADNLKLTAKRTKPFVHLSHNVA